MEKIKYYTVYKKTQQQQQEQQRKFKNHRPISLLPIFSKIFRKIIFNKIKYIFLLNEQLLNQNQSSF